MSEEETHPLVLVLAGIGLGAVAAGLAAYLLRPEPGQPSAEGVRRAAARLRKRTEDLARRVREQTSQLIETGREELGDAVRAGREAAEERRRELERELHT
jgi:gas vesicle protein